MRLIREQKLEMVLKHLRDGVSFRELAKEYKLSTDKNNAQQKRQKFYKQG